MDIFTIIAGSALVAFTAYVGFRLAYVIYANVKNGMLIRSLLSKRVGNLRLSKMLAALGVNVDKYLHEEKVLDIENQIERCTQCENTDICDENLQKGTITVDTIDYCNNESDLKSMLSPKAGLES